MSVHDHAARKDWDALFVYVNSIENERLAHFEYLLHYKASLADGCIFFGDFNSILFHSENREVIIHLMLAYQFFEILFPLVSLVLALLGTIDVKGMLI